MKRFLFGLIILAIIVVSFFLNGCEAKVFVKKYVKPASITEADVLEIIQEFLDDEYGDGNIIGIVELIDPCGDDEGETDEILIFLSNGQFVRYWKDDGHREFLTVLECPGEYVTYDRQECEFGLDGDCGYWEEEYE